MKNKIKNALILGMVGILSFNCLAFGIDDNAKNLKPKKQTWKEKRAEKEKQKYSRYLIPTENLVVPEEIEPDRLTIEGSVAKSLELSLADCLELALTYNPTLKAQYAESAAIKTLKGQALSNYSPTLDVNFGLSRLKPDISNSIVKMQNKTFNHYTAGEISVRQLIYDFGITQNLYKMRKYEYEESVNNIEATANEVICQVKTAYYFLVTAIMKERVMEDTVSQFEQTYEQAKAFYEVGVKPKIDVTIATTNLADARARLIRAKNDVSTATAALNNAMGLPFIVPYTINEDLPFDEFDTNIKELIEIANENRPSLKNAALSVKAQEQAWKLSKSYRPTLYFQGGFGGAGNSEISGVKDYWNLGGYLGFNSINPLQIKKQIDEQRNRYIKQQFVADSSVNDIYYEIQTTWANMIDAHDRVPVAKLSMQSSKENYELASGRYKVGESDAIELKDAQIQYQNSRLAYYNTLYEYNREKANLERAVGQTLKNKS